MERNYEREKKNVKEMRKTDEPTIPRIPSVRFSVRRLCCFFFSVHNVRCVFFCMATVIKKKKKFHVSCAAYLHQKRNRTKLYKSYACTHSLTHTHTIVQSAIDARIHIRKTMRLTSSGAE